MNEFVKDNLEDYLSGTLGESQRAEFDAYLEKNPAAADELATYEQSAALLRELRPPEGEDVSLAPGFYHRVLEQIEQERRIPFWTVFSQPPFGRRLAFASLMWFALLGGYLVTFQSPDLNSGPQMARTILAQPSSPDYKVRLGADLQQNRDSMLSVLIASGK